MNLPHSFASLANEWAAASAHQARSNDQAEYLADFTEVSVSRRGSALIRNRTVNTPYASSSQPTSSAAPSLFHVLTDPDLRLVSIAAISARDIFAFFASCS